jgi:hypothetical protein
MRFFWRGRNSASRLPSRLEPQTYSYYNLQVCPAVTLPASTIMWTNSFLKLSLFPLLLSLILMLSCSHSNIYVCVHYTYIHTYIYTYIYIHTHIYIGICAYLWDTYVYIVRNIHIGGPKIIKYLSIATLENRTFL